MEDSDLRVALQHRGGAFRRSASTSSAPGGTLLREQTWEQTKDALAGGMKRGFGWLSDLANRSSSRGALRGGSSRREASNPLKTRLQQRGGVNIQTQESACCEPEPFLDSMELEAQRRLSGDDVSESAKANDWRDVQNGRAAPSATRPEEQEQAIHADVRNSRRCLDRHVSNETRKEAAEKPRDCLLSVAGPPGTPPKEPNPSATRSRGSAMARTASAPNCFPQSPAVSHGKGDRQDVRSALHSGAPLFDTSAIKANRDFWTEKAKTQRISKGGYCMTREEAQDKLQVLARGSNVDLDEVRRIRRHVNELSAP